MILGPFGFLRNSNPRFGPAIFQGAVSTSALRRPTFSSTTCRESPGRHPPNMGVFRLREADKCTLQNPYLGIAAMATESWPEGVASWEDVGLYNNPVLLSLVLTCPRSVLIVSMENDKKKIKR